MIFRTSNSLQETQEALCKARAVTKTSYKLLTYRDLEIVCEIHVTSEESNKNNIHALQLKQAEYNIYKIAKYDKRNRLKQPICNAWGQHTLRLEEI